MFPQIEYLDLASSQDAPFYGEDLSVLSELTNLQFLSLRYYHNQTTGNLSSSSITATLPTDLLMLTSMETLLLHQYTSDDDNSVAVVVSEVFCKTWSRLKLLVIDCADNFNNSCSCCTCWTTGLNVF